MNQQYPLETRSSDAFIFDLDGTIVDTMPYHVSSWLQTLHQYGVNISAEELNQYNKGTIEEVIRQILGDDLPQSEVLAIADRKEALFRKSYRPHMEPIEGLLSFLNKASEINIELALATNAGQDNIEFILEGLNLQSLFTTIVGAKDIQNGKPHPEIFLLVAEKLKKHPDRCTVFEDSISGIEAARKAGMQIVCVATTHDVEFLLNIPGVSMAIEDYNSPRLSNLFQALVSGN